MARYIFDAHKDYNTLATIISCKDISEEKDSTDSTKNIDVPGFERTSLKIEFGHNCGGYWIFMQICNLKNEIDDGRFGLG